MKTLKQYISEKFSSDQVQKLKKAYEPLKGKKVNPTPLMKTFDKIDKNKNNISYDHC